MPVLYSGPWTTISLHVRPGARHWRLGYRGGLLGRCEDLLLPTPPFLRYAGSSVIYVACGDGPSRFLAGMGPGSVAVGWYASRVGLPAVHWPGRAAGDSMSALVVSIGEGSFGASILLPTVPEAG